MKHHVTAPRGLADLVAELAIGGALRVSTRLVGGDDRSPAALTVVYLDGDVTTTFTQACVAHPEAGELFGRHLQEIRRIDELLRQGAARIVRSVAWISAAATVLGVAIDAATGHSWLHSLATFFAIGSVSTVAIGLVRRFSTKILVRSVRRAMARSQRA